jgi:hypothetical protein
MAKNPNGPVNPDFREYETKGGRWMLDDLLTIFVDENEHLRKFLEGLVEVYSSDILKKVCSDVNIYHRLLECLLYNYNSYLRKVEKDHHHAKASDQTRAQELRKSIDDFVKSHETDIDKNYVLFLFQIYKYSEGVKNLCESLNLR